MPYNFNFDLTRLPKYFFTEIARVAYGKKVHKRVGKATRSLLEKFRIHEVTGLEVTEALMLLEDFVEIQMKNLVDREKFSETKRRALFLPHCSRKYMDNRCKACFDPRVPSYHCSHCSEDCLIHQATTLGEERGYDVYVLPGGACVEKILRNYRYEAVVGVACGEEIKLASNLLEKMDVPGQAVPLIKNGCANTKFNLQTLRELL